MAITGYELFRVMGAYVTADLLVWNRYKKRAPGILEALLDANPQLSVVHRSTPFIPPGTYVRIPIDHALIRGRPPAVNTNIWTDAKGYRL